MIQHKKTNGTMEKECRTERKQGVESKTAEKAKKKERTTEDRHRLTGSPPACNKRTESKKQ